MSAKKMQIQVNRSAVHSGFGLKNRKSAQV